MRFVRIVRRVAVEELAFGGGDYDAFVGIAIDSSFGVSERPFYQGQDVNIPIFEDDECCTCASIDNEHGASGEDCHATQNLHIQSVPMRISVWQNDSDSPEQEMALRP